MKVIAFNGSPGEKWNTAMLLEKTLEGAASLAQEEISKKSTLMGFARDSESRKGIKVQYKRLFTIPQDK